MLHKVCKRHSLLRPPLPSMTAAGKKEAVAHQTVDGAGRTCEPRAAQRRSTSVHVRVPDVASATLFCPVSSTMPFSLVVSFSVSTLLVLRSFVLSILGSVRTQTVTVTVQVVCPPSSAE